MKRWFWKRWVWAVVVGTTAAVGLTVAQPRGTEAPPAIPKVGDVITLPFRDGPPRQVKVLKIEKQPDGSYLSEVKDTKTGETLNLLDRPGDAPPPPSPGGNKAAPKIPDVPKGIETGPPKAKPRANDPPPPPLKDAPPEPAKDAKAGVMPAKPNTPAPEPEERPGLLKRIFGRKKAPDPQPAATTSGKPANLNPDPGPPLHPSMKPAPGAITVPSQRGTNEPPRSVSPQPVTPPAVVPTPKFPTAPPVPPAVKPAAPPVKSSSPPAVSIPVVPPTAKPVTPPPAFPPVTSTPVAPPANSAPIIPPVPPAVKPSDPPAAAPAPSAPVVPPATSTPVVPPPATSTPVVPPPSPPVVPPATSTPVVPPAPSSPSPPVVPPSTPAEPPATSAPAPAEPPAPAPTAPPATTPPPPPAVPSVPPVSVPAPGGLPPIPTPPGGLSMTAPAAPVQPAAHAAMPAATTVVVPGDHSTPAGQAMMRDIQPHVAALQTGSFPSERALAARALSGGRHGSTDAVKAMLFHAAQNDRAALVRTICIEELCKLGYNDPAFTTFLAKACDDPSADVKAAAKDALAKMAPRK